MIDNDNLKECRYKRKQEKQILVTSKNLYPEVADFYRFWIFYTYGSIIFIIILLRISEISQYPIWIKKISSKEKGGGQRAEGGYKTPQIK